MTATDFARAAGMALLVLVIDVAIAIAVVYAWSIFIEPGHPATFYQTAGIPIARWSTRLAGTALLLGAAWLGAKRRPARNAYLYAVALVLFYAIIDAATVGFQGLFEASFGLTILIKLIGAIAGAFMGIQTRAPAAAPT
jgi:hypothetical protein